MAVAADVRQAARAFCRDGGGCPIDPLGNGNINLTYLVRSKAGPFVLQRINRQVFPYPLRIIENFAKVSLHLAKMQGQSETRFRSARPVPTLTGGLYFHDAQGEYWRGQTYLPHPGCGDLAFPGQAFQVGRALASFHGLASGLDIQDLLDPLPGFHDLPGYLREFDRLGTSGRSLSQAGEQFCCLAIETHRDRATRLAAAKDAGIFSLQPIHGDPKIDNFLFDGQGLADGMLDLDTVGPGIVPSDLGDCLRSCCNRGGEGGGGAVSFDLGLCRELLAGYFSQQRQHPRTPQREYIFDAVLAITFELGLRFFSDHLRGNIYFKVEYAGENLLRAKRQFLLVEDIIAKESQIRRLPEGNP